MLDPMLKLGDRLNILGRALVVHAQADTSTQPTCNGGARVASGLIGVAKSKD